MLIINNQIIIEFFFFEFIRYNYKFIKIRSTSLILLKCINNLTIKLTIYIINKLQIII